jgi:hypothetical protein
MKFLLVTTVMGANTVNLIAVSDDFVLQHRPRALAMQNGLLIEEVKALPVQLNTEDGVIGALTDIINVRAEERQR